MATKIVKINKLWLDEATNKMLAEVEDITTNIDKIAAEDKFPLGDYRYSGHLTRKGVAFDWTMYEKGLSITISQHNNNQHDVLYSQNFTSLSTAAWQEIEKVTKGQADIDDLIFRLKELKDIELKR